MTEKIDDIRDLTAAIVRLAEATESNGKKLDKLSAELAPLTKNAAIVSKRLRDIREILMGIGKAEGAAGVVKAAIQSVAGAFLRNVGKFS